MPSLPEDVWQRFLMDDEHAIRASAPKEPSARQRAFGRLPQPARTDDGTGQRYDAADAVGDLWHPDDPGGPVLAGPGRARPDTPGRPCRGHGRRDRPGPGRLVPAVHRRGHPAEGPGDTVLQQSEDAPATLPAVTSRPAGLTSPSASGIQAG